MSNKGKKRYWRCANAEHYYDDFVNTCLCHSPRRKINECVFRGKTLEMQKCKMFERGKESFYL